MEVLYVIVPLAVAFAGLALLGFGWSVYSGQYDDAVGPPNRVLLEDETIHPATKEIANRTVR